MLAHDHKSIAEHLRSIPYASVMNVVLAYREQDVGVSLNSSGFVVPRKEERKITACTWTSCKWEHTAPAILFLISHIDTCFRILACRLHF
ncbi:hypothetical protein [Paenibacillus amylolyticus]